MGRFIWILVLLLYLIQESTASNQVDPLLTIAAETVAVDVNPGDDSFTIRSVRSRSLSPQVTVRWNTIIEKIRPFTTSTPGYAYIPTAPPLRVIPMNSSSIAKSYTLENVTWSAENPVVPKASFVFAFDDAARVEFPLYAFSKADRVHFPLGTNLSLPIDANAIKFSLSLTNWNHSGDPAQGELWLGFNIELMFDMPVIFDTYMFALHNLTNPGCTNGSSPNFGSGPINTARVEFENLPGTFLRVGIPDLALVDNTSFACLQAVNSLSRDLSVIANFLNSGRRRIAFDLLFRASTSIEYDPDLTLVFGAGFDQTPPVSIPPNTAPGSDPNLSNSENGQIGVIAGVIVAVVVAAVIVFIIAAIRFKPLRTRLSVMQWKTSASSKISRLQEDHDRGKPLTAQNAASELPRQSSSWASAKVSSGARNSVLTQ